MPELITPPTPEATAARRSPVTLTGVFQHLVDEHAELVASLERTIDAASGDAKRTLWKDLREGLLSHERAKIQEVYPAFDEYPSLRRLVDEPAHQARIIESVVRNLTELPFESPDWVAELERLRDTVLAHIDNEQGQVFPSAQHAMGPDRAQVLQLPYVSARRTHALAFTRKPRLPKSHPRGA